jgi:hypothetical protein
MIVNVLAKQMGFSAQLFCKPPKSNIIAVDDDRAENTPLWTQ